MIDIKVAPEHRETLERLDKLAVELKTKAVGSGLTAVAKPIKATMKALADEDTGLLRNAIISRRLSGRAAARLKIFGESVKLEPGQVAILIGPNKRQAGFSRARVSNLLEFGTKPHAISPRGRRGLRSVLRIGASGFARKVHHPGVKPTRFMQRSLEQNRSQIETLFFQGVGKRIDKLI